MKKQLSSAIAAVITVVAVQSSSADTVELEYYGHLGSAVTVYATQEGSDVIRNGTLTWVGPYCFWMRNPVDTDFDGTNEGTVWVPADGTSESFKLFCFDLYQYVSGDPKTYDIDYVTNAPIGGTPTPVKVTEDQERIASNLTAEFYDPAVDETSGFTADLSFLGHTSWASADRQLIGDALGAAFWEIIYEPNPVGDYDVLTMNGVNGTFGFKLEDRNGSEWGNGENDGKAAHLANAMSAWATTGPGYAGLRALTRDDGQGQLIGLPEMTRLPEPSTVVNLASLGLMLSLVGYRRRHRKH